MKKNRQIATWIIICLLWELLVVGVHIFMLSQLKYPTLNLEVLGWLIPVFMAMPFGALALGVVSVHRKRFMKVFAVIFTSLGIVVYITYITLITAGFACLPGLYPLMSETESVADYLVFDGRFDENYDEITKIMPETIPENATNIIYNYKYEAESYGYMYAYWELPEAEYEAFKKETLQKDGDVTIDSRGTIFKYSWYADSFPHSNWSELIFNDDSHSISYTVRQSYSC